MKILLTNNHLDSLAGSETWTYTMALELLRQGHEVEVFTFKPGIITEKLKKYCCITDKPGDYDLALINHNSCLNFLKDKNFPKIFTSHGVIPVLEVPVEGADRYVSISEYVQYFRYISNFHSVVIRNGLDCNRFKPFDEINQRPENALVLSNYGNQEMLNNIIHCCGKMDIKIKTCGLISEPVWNIEEEINRADIVFAIGRGCYEAMACGRNVIVSDIHGADGYIDSENIMESRKFSCSGRRYRRNPSVDYLMAELGKYTPGQGTKNREYILAHHNIETIAGQYVTLMDKVPDCQFTVDDDDRILFDLNRIIDDREIIIMEQKNYITELERNISHLVVPFPKKIERAFRKNILYPIIRKKIHS